MSTKIKWKVAPKETGRYRSFYPRHWPTAEYKDGTLCALLYCDDAYVPCNVKMANHRMIKVMVINHATSTPELRQYKVTHVRTLDDAKAAVVRILTKYPEVIPTGAQS